MSRKTRQRKAFDIWQIVYIDLMTNVMIFFVVLWAVQASFSKKGGVSDTIGTETVKMVNLPGDVLFPTGRSELSGDGARILRQLFQDQTGTVLNFDTGVLTKRVLVIHGHTDGDGDKDQNLSLGYSRALSAYQEIRQYGEALTDHVVLCTHADNTPAQEVPAFGDALTPAEVAAVREAKAKNRRITIEDKVLSRSKEAIR